MLLTRTVGSLLAPTDAGSGGGARTAPRVGFAAALVFAMGASLLHPIPLFCVSYVVGGLLLDLTDIVANHSVSWWDQPNAVILGAGATTFVAYVIAITEVLRNVRYQDQRHSEDRPTELMGE